MSPVPTFLCFGDASTRLVLCRMENQANALNRQDYSEAPLRLAAVLDNYAILFGWHFIFG